MIGAEVEQVMIAADDEVILEATGNAAAIVRSLRPYVSKVVIANPLQARATAPARVKTDKIDAGILAQLHASGFLPTVWMPDADTEALRRQVSRRTQLLRHGTRLKNEMHSVLHAHLIPRCPYTDLFGKKGRAWLAQQQLPKDELCGLKQGPVRNSVFRGISWRLGVKYAEKEEVRCKLSR